MLIEGGMEVFDCPVTGKYFHNNNVEIWIANLYNLMLRQFDIPNSKAIEFASIENWKDYISDGYTPLEALEEDSQYWDWGEDFPPSSLYNFDEHWSDHNNGC